MDDFPQQGVTERDVRVVRPAGVHEDPSIDDIAKGRAHDGRREVAHRNEQFVVDPGPGRGRDPKDLLSRVRDRRDASEEDIPKSRRDGVATRLPRRRDHLFGVERVPIGPLQRPVDQPGVRLVAELVREQPGQVAPVEAREVDPIDALAALELGQEGHE